MPQVRTVFGHVVDVDDDEAAVLARQGLVAEDGPEPGTDDSAEPDTDPEDSE